jgi:general secretion pathway protein C
MGILLRKYFWVINLLTITLCAVFAATAVGKLVESKIPQPPPPKITAPPPQLGQAGTNPQARDITDILDRNMFCSTCKKVEETPLNATEDTSTAVSASDVPVKTSLNLKLLATMVSEEDKAWSFAAILDNTEGQEGLYAIGKTVPGNAVVTDIMTRRVLLLNQGRNEYLDLNETADQKVASAPAAPLSSTVTPPGGLPMPRAARGLEGIASGIKKVGEGKYEIRRSALNRVLANTTLLARSARIVPSVRNGKPNGFKLYAIRPGSLYSLLGMFNGDTINAINGHPITTPDKALEIYTKLRSASHLSIAFNRRGKPITHEYNIR